MVIVSDTSPIANLILINQLELLKLVFKVVIIPPTVDKEIRALEQFGVDLKNYYSSNWIELKKPTNEIEVKTLKKQLDAGESEAISLAKELNAKYLLIDERIGSEIAHQEGLQTIGLLGIIVKAKEEKHIDKVKPIIKELRTAGFWISDKLVKTILEKVGE